MIQTTLWIPPCGCQIEFTWDDAVPAEQRVHRGFHCFKVCPGHAPLLPDAAKAEFLKHPRALGTGRERLTKIPPARQAQAHALYNAVRADLIRQQAERLARGEDV